MSDFLHQGLAQEDWPLLQRPEILSALIKLLSLLLYLSFGPKAKLVESGAPIVWALSATTTHGWTPPNRSKPKRGPPTAAEKIVDRSLLIFSVPLLLACQNISTVD